MIYKKDYNDNNEYFNKVFEPNLGRGKPIYPDIAVPTYWMAARLIGLNEPAPWVEPLPLDQIPNHANLVTAYTELPWDMGAKHQMPWQAGITGIAYDPKMTGFEIKSFNDIFDPRLQGKVGFLTEIHDSVGLTMLGMGLDPSKPDFEGAEQGARQDRRREEGRQDPQVHGQRVPALTAERRLPGVPGLVGRHRAAQP